MSSVRLRATLSRIRKIITFTTAIKIIKYLGTNLTKEVKHLNNENYKNLRKEVKEDKDKWKDIPCSRIRRFNVVKNVHTTLSDL